MHLHLFNVVLQLDWLLWPDNPNIKCPWQSTGDMVSLATLGYQGLSCHTGMLLLMAPTASIKLWSIMYCHTPLLFGPHHAKSSFFAAISLICCHCECFPFNFLCVSIIRKTVVWMSFPFFTEMTHHFLKFRLWVKVLLRGFEVANIKMQNQWKGQTYAEM